MAFAAMVVVSLCKPAGAAMDLPPSRAGYRDLLNLYPLVVVGSWDPADYKRKTAQKGTYALGEIRLRVHRVLKGKCPKVIEVKFKDRFSVRYGADGRMFMGWQRDAARPERNRWAICCNSQLFNPGGRVPSPVIRDVRRPAVYFLGRRQLASVGYDYRYIIRGEKWKAFPFAIPGPYRKARSAEIPAGPKLESARKVGTRPADRPTELIISMLNEVQPAYLADGWAALLAGKQPDVFFRALQPFDPYSRNAALAELRRRKDRDMWARVVDAAISNDVLGTLDYAKGQMFAEVLLSRLKSQRLMLYARLWDVAFTAAPDEALAAARQMLNSPAASAQQKQDILGRIKVHSDSEDGSRCAVLIAQSLCDKDEKVKETALRCLVGMLVDRGGTFPAWSQYGYLSADPWCYQGALQKVVDALKKSLGQTGFEKILKDHPALRTAVRPRVMRGRKWPKDRFASDLKLFEDGRLPKGPQVNAWETLAFHKTKDFALDAMVRALVTEQIEHYHRECCMVALIEAAILFPNRLRPHLEKLGEQDNLDVLAVRCFLDPTTDPAPLTRKLLERGGPSGEKRIQWYCRAIGVTTADRAKRLLGQVIEKTPDYQVRCRAVQAMVGRFGRDAAYQSIRKVVRAQKSTLDLCRPAPPPPAPDQQAQAVKLLKGIIRTARRDGPLYLSSEEFEKYHKAVDVLRNADSAEAMRTIYEFILQRPYSQDLQAGTHTPWKTYGACLDTLLEKDTQLYFSALKNLLADEDSQWRWLANRYLYDTLGAHRIKVAGIAAKFSDQPHKGPLELRLALLEHFGVKVERPQSGEGIKILAEVAFGKPALPISAYSRGENDEAVTHLAIWVIGRTFGPLGEYAADACKKLPEEERAKALIAVLDRLLKRGPIEQARPSTQ